VGYEEDEEGFVLIPLDEAGGELEPGSETREITEGDIAIRVLRADEVYADPEAKTVNGPYDRAQWMIVRRWRDLQAARFETGRPDLKPDGDSAQDLLLGGELDTVLGGGTATFKGGLPPFPQSRRRNRESVWEYLIYFAPNGELGIEDGAWVRLIGDTFMGGARSLPGRKIPLARYTDGSSDPQLFPRPVVAGWIGKQTTINALVSKLVAHVRVMGGGRIITQRGTILRETFQTIIGSVMEYTGTKPDFQGGSAVSGDVWKTLFQMVKKLEDETGWNDLARGQVGGSGGGSGFNDVSGRALLGAKELFERTFGPVVQATAEGESELAALIVDYARFLFDTPRLIPVAGRPDLAKRIKAETLGEESAVYADPETLMPLPKSLRNQMLVDSLDKGLITVEEFRKRSPFADIRNLHMGDVDHWERAQFINSLLEERWEDYAQMQRQERFTPGPGLPALWQDITTVHKAALLEIALDERKAFALRELAVERWGVYDQLERFQAGGALLPPAEVLGIPPDVMLMLEQQAQAAAAGGGAPPAPAGGGEGVQAPQGPAPALSPVPQQSAGGAPALGQHGDVERQAVELSQGR
jgi:hypothetical protein